MRSERVIFVVDDHRLIADTLAIILRAEGYKAIAFHRPEEALAMAQTVPPAMLVSDLRMPSMDGCTLADRIHALWPDCKIIMISGSCRDAISEKTGERFDFLEKPVPIPELLAIVSSTLGSRELRESA